MFTSRVVKMNNKESLHFLFIQHFCFLCNDPNCVHKSCSSLTPCFTVLPSSSGDSFLLLVLWGEAPCTSRHFTFCTSPALTARVSAVSPPTAVLSSRLNPWAATNTNTITHRGGQHVHSWSSYRTDSWDNWADDLVSYGHPAGWPPGWMDGEQHHRLF